MNSPGLFTYPPFTANGNVSPSRFLTPVAGTAKRLVQASASTAPIYGVSGKNTRFPPGSPSDDGFHAIAGEQLTVHGPGQICSLKLGSTAVTDLTVPLTTDGSGQGLPQAPANATTCYYGAIPLTLGAASDTIAVFVLPLTITV